jgi:hypothetical protein
MLTPLFNAKMELPAPSTKRFDAPRRDTGNMRVAVENVEEQPVHMPLGSATHFENAISTAKSIMAGKLTWRIKMHDVIVWHRMNL